MAHVLKPQGVLLTSIEEATKDGNKHLDILERNGKRYPLIVFEQFINDYVAAVGVLQIRLKQVPLPAKLAGDFLTVWPS